MYDQSVGVGMVTHVCTCELICGTHVDSKHVVLSADMHVDTLRAHVCIQMMYLCIQINIYRAFVCVCVCVFGVCNGHIQAINVQMWWYACK